MVCSAFIMSSFICRFHGYIYLSHRSEKRVGFLKTVINCGNSVLISDNSVFIYRKRSLVELVRKIFVSVSFSVGVGSVIAILFGNKHRRMGEERFS